MLLNEMSNTALNAISTDKITSIVFLTVFRISLSNINKVTSTEVGMSF